MQLVSLETIEKSLINSFKGCELNLIDDSSSHVGHLGHVEGKITHIEIDIKHDSFEGMTTIQAHRAVYKALEEFKDLHAISIKIRR